MDHSRRSFIQKSLVAGTGLTLLNPLSAFSMQKNSKMQLGLVTYQWGKDWDLPTLISNCEKSGLLGVELRTEHAHGVETSLMHIRELNVGNYPYPKLMNLFSDMNYEGWILLEARTTPEDRISAMKEQKKLFLDMTS